MHTVVRPSWGDVSSYRHPGCWIARRPQGLRVAGAACRRYLQASRGGGIRVSMASLARGRAAAVRRRGPGAGVLAAERGGGVRAGGGGVGRPGGGAGGPPRLRPRGGAPL